LTKASCATAGSLEEPLEEVGVLDEVAQAEEVLAYAFSSMSWIGRLARWVA
jgi:hypothetical protein